MNNRHIDLYMDLATRIALMSHAVRLKVGSVIVKNNSIISFGWNGMPSGWDNNCEKIEYMDSTSGGWLAPEEIYERWPFVEDDLDPDLGYARRYRLKTKDEVLHAEMNALMKVSQSTESSAETIMFCTHAPCINCAKAMHQAGIVEVIYKNTYRTEEGLYFLEKCGVKLTKYVENDK